MRYVLAIVTLVLSAVLLILGVGQRTFLAGPSELRYPVGSETAPYLVVDAEQLNEVPGQGNIVVTDEAVFAAIAKTRDVEGWVGPFTRAVVEFDAESATFTNAEILTAADTLAATPESEADAASAADTDDAAATDAEGAEAEEEQLPDQNPRGSDLWIETLTVDVDAAAADEDGADEADAGEEASDEESATEVPLRLPIALQNDESIIIAVDGTEPVVSGAELVWVQDRQTPWAGPLLTAGAVLAIVGAILYLMAFDHDRRGLGPRRGRKGPFIGIRNMFRAKPKASTVSEKLEGTEMRATTRRHRWALPALGMTAVLTLSGCSASYWPSTGDESVQQETETSAPEEGSSRAPVPVTEAQVARILADVAKISQSADEQLDAALLEPRFAADALAQRTANYTIRNAVADYASIPALITDEAREYQLVQSTEGWPRTLFLTTASETPEASEGEEDAPEAPSIALMLTQETPHDNFLVNRVFMLRGGISMPQAAPADEGTALVSNDMQTLLVAPGEVGSLYASILQGGTDVEGAELFDLEGDTLLENYGLARVVKETEDAELGDDQVKRSVTVEQGDAPVIALSTGLGGALVATTVIERYVTESLDDLVVLGVGDAVAALSGLEGDQERLVQTVSHQLLFYVPNANSGEQIQLLGTTDELIAAGN